MAHKWDPICPPPGGLVRPVRLDPAGLTGPTRGQARGPRWRSTSHGFYVPADVDASLPEQRIVEQAVRLPEGGAVTGWASLRLHRAGFFDGLARDGHTPVPVPLVVGRLSKMKPNQHVTVSKDPLLREEVEFQYDIPCTTVERAVFDEMRRAGEVPEAVVVMDMVAAALLTSIRRMWKYWAARRSWRRAALVAQALALASERSRSPQESRVRLIWVRDAGLPAPLVNQHVWDLAGNLLGIADLLDVRAGMVVEFDGADHRKARRHTDDIRRQERFERQGLEVCRVTGLDVPDRRRIVERIHFHRSRALWLPAAERRWTLVPPQDWEPEQSLDDYLDERDWHLALNREAARQGII